MKEPLDAGERGPIVRKLRLEAIRHRLFLLRLGHDKGIRLHYGAMMSMVEIVTALYRYWMKIDPKNPTWTERDRFILSKGHGAPSLYVTLSMTGYFDAGVFDGFRRLGSPLQGHPDRNKTPGVDCTTGSLGQGFPVACGMALGSMLDGSRFRVYVLISDGECNEGSVWEAAQIASNLHIDTVTALVDWNKKSSYGPMRGRNDIEPLADKWNAFNWHTIECNGHDFVSLAEALDKAERQKGKPSVVLCHTVKGKGIPFAETHHTSSNFFLKEEQYQEAVRHLEALEEEVRNGSA
jgi:transketolase